MRCTRMSELIERAGGREGEEGKSVVTRKKEVGKEGGGRGQEK